MKKKSLFFGLIFALLAPLSQAQIVEVYRQGFETTGEAFGYTVAGGNAAPQSTLAMTGNRALRMHHVNGTATVVYTDTIDFTFNSSISFLSLEFDHACDIQPSACGSPSNVCIVEYKPVGTATWTRLGTGHYDEDRDEYSGDFSGTSSFSNQSYTGWKTGNASNTWWKHERFKLDNQIPTTQSDRRVQFRFTVYAANNNQSSRGWYLDNISVRVSANSMSAPRIAMAAWPEDMMPFPTSRSARVEANIRTQATQGLCFDSVYLLYKLSNAANAPVYRENVTVVSSTNNNSGNPIQARVRAYIPFVGYDTIVSWRFVVKDNTSNHNLSTYPSGDDQWSRYYCVRGVANQQLLSSALSVPVANNSNLPFPAQALHKSQMVYTQGMMSSAGYGPGAVTGMTMIAGSNVNHSTRTRFVVYGANVSEDFVVPPSNSGNPWFYAEGRKVLYDSVLDLTQNANTVFTLNFQDTFFYSGKTAILQVVSYVKNASNRYVDPTGMAVKAFATPSATPSLVKSGDALASNTGGLDPFTSSNFVNGTPENNIPDGTFVCLANLPLVYDCGIVGFVTPNDTITASATGANSVTVTLKNFGVQPMNAITIYYQVDGGAHQSYNWTGNLAGGATTQVTLNTNQAFSAGYHEMRAWVEDSILCGGVRYRDHEPLNDTAWTKMVSCAGPMSGVRQVGGAGADFTDIEKFLYAVSRCGVNGPLQVKLAPGTYAPIAPPTIPGASQVNFVQFEPLNGNANSVQFATNQANCPTPLVDLRNTRYLRFKKISFVTTYNNNITHPVRLGVSSVGCQFIECLFDEGISTNSALANSTRAVALLYSGGADSLTVDGCTFNRGNIGISMVGPAADNLARGAVIRRSTFNNQGTNNLVVRNHISSIVDSNTVLNLITGAGYQMLFQDCHDAMRVTRNTAYVTSGASCLGVTDFFGTAAHGAVIANNMLICADDGTANMLTTPMFIISAEYTKIVHNSVKMTAPTRAGVATAQLGGGVIDHCYFYNNIISCFDTANFALSYYPYGGNVNYIGNNIYYSRSYILNKYDGSTCTNIASWNTHIGDGASQQVNPAFLGLTLTDLSTYSLNVKGHGVPIAEVTDDIYGTPRDAAAPCVGAFEFANLPYDFEIVGLVEPYDEYCNVPAAGAPLRVQIKNNGINDYIPGQSGNLVLTYSRTNRPGVMVPGQSGNLQVTNTIPGNSTVTCSFNANLLFPTNGLLDTTYTFTFWLTSTIDVNHINDTSSYTVTARNHPNAPTAINQNVPYGTAATVNVTQGIQTWRTTGYNSGRQDPSTIYWYLDTAASSAPIHSGASFTTGVLYEDTTLYIRQSRDLGLMRISEVQIKNNGVGASNPMPLWMNAQTKCAVELINVGDYPAHLLGDSLVFVHVQNNNNAGNLNNKGYRFPDVTVQPGQSIVVQFRANTATPDSSVTLGASTMEPGTGHFAVLYVDHGGIADAVAFNEVTTKGNHWNNRHVPAAVWSGAGISLVDPNATNNSMLNTAGVTRKAWPSNPNASPSNSAQYWQIADSTHSMNIGTNNSNLVMYTSNGCLGDVAPVNIHLTNLPPADLALDSIVTSEGCDLNLEPVTVTVHNFGSQNSGTFVLNCSVNGTILCSDTLPGLNPREAVTHTFSQMANMYVASGIQYFDIRAWVNHITGDNATFNDTTSLTIYSSFTPGAPAVNTYQTVPYAGQLLLSTINPPADSLRWYNRFMDEVATVNNYRTPHLFRADTFYVSALAPAPNDVHVGTLASVNGNTAYPSPFNPNKRYGQEQYIFLASELHAAGHQAGPITGLSFYLDTVRVSGGSFTISNYTIGIATTTASAFNNTSNPAVKWQPVTQVYAQSNLTLSNAHKGWIHFDFNTPFLWDGVSNIVVGVTREMSAAITAGAQTRYTPAFTGAAYQKNDANAVTLNTGAGGNGSPSPNRPDIQFRFQDYGCEGPTSPIYISVTGNPSTDAGIEWPAEYDTLLFTSCGNTNIDVNIINNGTATLTGAAIDYWVDGVHGMFNFTDSVQFDSTARVTIVAPHLTPGRHHLRAAITVPGDTISVNDTISRVISVSFCGGTYTIGPSANNDYPSIPVALDTLYGAGVAGPVVFNIESGTYRKQLEFGAIRGTSRTNNVTFQSATGNPADVTLVFDSITAARNFVVNIDGAQWLNFRHLHIFANGNVPASSNAIKVTNSEQVRFTGCHIEVKSTVNNANSNGIMIYPNVHSLYIDSCEFSAGYYAIRTVVSERNLTSGIYITDNNIHNFWSTAIALRKVNDISVRHNDIRGGVTISSRLLVGIQVGEAEGGINIERNNVVLFDNANGGKKPIIVSNCVANNLDRGRVYNNMCVAQGTGANGGASQGITIDSSSFINVYYNTVRVYAGANSPATRALSVQSISTSINVLNNIFANFSRGYAYWLNNMNNVAQSNYNVFFADTAAATRKLARIGNDELPTLDTLRLVTGKEPNSLFDQPYFVAPDDLHMAFGLYNELALYLPDVTNDIDGDTRPAIPAPCIGADEYPRCIHDIAIMQFVSPTLESNPNPIEGDTLWVTLKLFNNGTSTETNLWWRANIVGRPDLTTPTVNIAEMSPSEVLFSTSYIVMPMGLIDTQRIEAFFSNDMTGECAIWSNSADTVFFLDMAYDLMVTGNDAIAVTTDVGHGEGCRLWAAPVTLTVTNKGHKPVPTNIPFTIGYEVRLPSTANYTVNQIPLVHEETYTLTQPIGINESVPLTFATPVNIYPTGNSRDISVRIRGWVSHPNDQKHVGNNSKDTTGTIVGNNPWNNWKSVSSKYLPNPPVGNDLHIPYGTWDTITASQSEYLPGTTAGRPIMWFRDSTDAEPYHAPTQYARSCWWETPQYYHDSTYYLACVSAGTSTNPGCTSYYSPVTVYVNPRVQNDVSIMSDTLYYDRPGFRRYNPVVEPYSKVYMTNDTVKVHIVNYGSNAISNIPVYYQLRRAGNNQPVLQEVREVCTATIQPDSLYLFKFDSLVELPYANSNYTLRIWTDLPSDPVRANDTIRHLYNFSTLPENFYETPTIAAPGGLDITHVSFSSLCNDVPEVWRDYRNFGDFNNPDVPVLRMIKGTTDTMIVEVANSDNLGDITSLGSLTMLIDFDRNGVFDNTDPEVAFYDPNGYTEVFFVDTISSRHRRKFVYTIPDDISLGYTRMRLVLETGAIGIYNSLDFPSGCVHDYLLYIEDVPVETDVALSRVVSPVSRFITEDTTAVTVLISNKGSAPVTQAEIGFRIHHGTSISHGSYTWNGLLEPGTSVPVTLPGRHLEEGTSRFVIWANVLGDTLSDNDTLRCEYHRFKVRTLIVSDNFVDDRCGWYAPKGYNAFSQNLWEMGVPTKAHLNTAVSDSCVLATNIHGNVSTGNYGNLSIIYSPRIDINQVQPDTISFFLAASIGDSAAVWLEYLNYEHRWMRVGTANDTNWYNGGTGFVGRIDNYAYNEYKFSFGPYYTDCPGITQFRLVYQAHPGARTDEGVIIDSIRFGRAQRAIDVGVVAITHPTAPRFGETIYPKVAIKNFGYDTVRSVNLAYRPYGSNLPKTGTFNGVIPPGETKIYTFTEPFTVMADFPDTFQICAFTTVNMDLYWENDSTCKDFGLSPLDNDMALTQILYPLDRIVAGDSIEVTVRLRNYGQAPVTSADVTYVFNNFFTVTETVDFAARTEEGQLGSYEYYNYTFRRKCRATMGSMNIMAYVDMPNDDYRFNDTVSKTISGISSIVDLRSGGGLVDNSVGGMARPVIFVENNGALACNDFEVGFYYDNDPSTAIVDTIHIDPTFPALTSLYHYFDTLLTERTAPNGYFYITTWVHHPDDNDPTNDTSTHIIDGYFDLSVQKVLVEENRTDECRLRLVAVNLGSMPKFTGNVSSRWTATVNGYTRTGTGPNVLSPGQVYVIDLDGTIPKSPNRTYVGTGDVTHPVLGDADPTNNQTSLIEVVNYFGIPSVEHDGFTLDQNYPNPFDEQTRIDFHTPTSGHVRFFVMDIMGRLVYQSEKYYPAGDNSIHFQSTELSTGVYYYGIEMDDTRLMRKMVYKK